MTIPKRSRFQRILKWAGVGVCGVMMTIWITSLQFALSYGGLDVTPTITVGQIVLYHGDYHLESGFRIDQTGGYGGWPWYFRLGLVWPDKADLNWGRAGQVPLWLPFVVAAIPTGYLYWRDRLRIPPGHCQRCGYNLTGNVSGVCSECGEPCRRDAT